MEVYKRLFKEWNPDAFKKAREQGLLDSPPPKKTYHSIPDYIIEYYKIERNLDDIDIKDIYNTLRNIKKNKIDSGSYSVRIVVYKNNFYSIGDDYKDNYIHLDILTYLVLKGGLKFKNLDDFLEFNELKHLKNFLCLHLVDPKLKTKQLRFSESYDNHTETLITNIVEKNVNNYKTIIKNILDITQTTLYSPFGNIEGLPMSKVFKGW